MSTRGTDAAQVDKQDGTGASHWSEAATMRNGRKWLWSDAVIGWGMFDGRFCLRSLGGVVELQSKAGACH